MISSLQDHPRMIFLLHTLIPTVSELSDMAMDSDDDPAQIVPPSQKVTTDLNEIANTIISNDYTPPSGSTIQTDPIAEALASTINRWLRTCPSKNDTKGYFQKCLVPSNVEGLNPVQINEMVYPRLSFKAKDSDKKLKSFNTFFTRAAAPLTTILDYLIKIEAKAKQNDQMVPSFEVENKTVTMSDIRCLLVDSLHLICAANAITLQKRRVSIRPYLDNKYHALTKPSNPVTSKLLGDNIEQKISDIFKVSQVTKRRTNIFKNNNFKQDRFHKKSFYRQNRNFDRKYSRTNNFNYKSNKYSRNSQFQRRPQSSGQNFNNFKQRFQNKNVNKTFRKNYNIMQNK